MVIPPVNTVSYVTSTASISATQNEQRVMRYVEINGVQRVETKVVLYNRQGQLDMAEPKGATVDYYG